MEKKHTIGVYVIDIEWQSDVWHIDVPRPEGVYMPYITHCHANVT